MPTKSPAKKTPTKAVTKSAPGKGAVAKKTAIAPTPADDIDVGEVGKMIVEWVKDGTLDHVLVDLDNAIGDRIAVENDRIMAEEKKSAAAKRSTVTAPKEVPAPVRKSIVLKVNTVYTFSAAAIAKKPELKGLKVKFLRYANVNGVVDKNRAYVEVTGAVSGYPKGSNKVFPSAALIPAPARAPRGSK